MKRTSIGCFQDRSNSYKELFFDQKDGKKMKNIRMKIGSNFELGLKCAG